MNDDKTGWTEADATPRIIAQCVWGLGVAIRKAWLYVCAPVGAFVLVVAYFLSHLPRA